MMPLLPIALLALLVSCGVYGTSFDCPPGQGVPCASVSEIEGMIVETDRGPDLFLPDLQEERGELALFGLTGGRCSVAQRPRRVWIAPRCTADGHIIHGHYLEEESCSH